MNYTEYSFSYTDNFKLQALIWAEEFDFLTFLENNGINYPYGPFDNILAVGHKSNEIQDLTMLEKVISNQNNWLFGFFSYELKNQLENLQSDNVEYFKSPDLLFFIPETIIFFSRNNVKIHSLKDPSNVYNEIIHIKSLVQNRTAGIKLLQRTSKAEYIQNVETIRKHILKGDIYEINYCIDFYSEGTHINPISTFIRLNEISPMPFSAFGKFDKKYVMCASPERYISKTGTKIISQPIKGTIKRGKNYEEDVELSLILATSEKERSENIMIVDLVRNDLSRTAVPGSVNVRELCKIYSFASVHQMISTIESKLSPEFSGLDAICNSFPMGSMTGAPKVSALKLIDTFENFKRGLYSGSIGYFTPNGDFDFNVIIRSILYDKECHLVSCPVGSAITYQSISEQEYEECLLKVQTMREALN